MIELREGRQNLHTKKIAILGFGKIAKDQHVPSIAETNGLELVATISSRGEAPDGLPSFTSIEDLADSDIEVDAIAFCSPPKGRLAAAMLAIDSGWDILLEKPPAATLAEVQALAQYADHAGRIIFTTWHSQYNAAVDAAARRLVGQQFTSFQIDWKEDVRKWHPGQEWIWQAGGFGIFDPGINALSIATKIAPTPLIIESASLEIAENHQSPIAAHLKFGGALTNIGAATFDWRGTSEEVWHIAIETPQERLLLDKGGCELWVDGELFVSEPSREYRHIYQRFAQMLESRESLVDLAPLQLVADAFLLGDRRPAGVF